MRYDIGGPTGIFLDGLLDGGVSLEDLIAVDDSDV